MTNPVFNGLIPPDVFELWAQWDNGQNYRELVREADGSVRDRARPAWAQPIYVDLTMLAVQLGEIPALESLPQMPSSVNWNAWDWQTMTLKPGGYTEVCLVVNVRAYNPEGNRARRWWAACSIIPDEPDKAVFVRYDRMDHVNIVTAPADKVVTFIETVKNL